MSPGKMCLFSSLKFAKKMLYVNCLAELAEYVHLEHIDIPQAVREWVSRCWWRIRWLLCPSMAVPGIVRNLHLTSWFHEFIRSCNLEQNCWWGSLAILPSWDQHWEGEEAKMVEYKIWMGSKQCFKLLPALFPSQLNQAPKSHVDEEFACDSLRYFL